MVAIPGPKPKTVRVSITVSENTLYQIDAVEKNRAFLVYYSTISHLQ
jgi:hypothetical protein